MAVYHDYLPRALSMTNRALDPTQEALTFLSYKANDWCNKIGTNYAEVVCGHTQWEQSQDYVTNSWGQFQDAKLQIMLKGPHFRDGSLAALGVPPWQVFNIGMSSRYSNYQNFRCYLEEEPDNVYGDGDIFNMDNWYRNPNGSIRMDSYVDLSTQSGAARIDDDEFGRNNTTWVLYSDTPGNRYFAWSLLGEKDQTGMNGVLKEVEIAQDAPAGCDIGWAYTFFNNTSDTWPLTQSIDPGISGRFSHRALNERFKRTEDNLGGSQDYSFGRPLYVSHALPDYVGEVIAYDRYFPCTNYATFSRYWTYEVNGKQYMAVSPNHLLPLF